MNYYGDLQRGEQFLIPRFVKRKVFLLFTFQSHTDFRCFYRSQAMTRDEVTKGTCGSTTASSWLRSMRCMNQVAMTDTWECVPVVTASGMTAEVSRRKLPANLRILSGSKTNKPYGIISCTTRMELCVSTLHVILK